MTKQNKPKVNNGLHYLGGGWLLDVPARDLTAEEVVWFGSELLLKSGLYVEIEQPDEPVDEEVEQWQE